MKFDRRRMQGWRNTRGIRGTNETGPVETCFLFLDADNLREIDYFESAIIDDFYLP